jgi:hypothetical protein
MGIIETLQAEIQALKERVTALEQRAKGSDDKIFRMTPEQREAARARLQVKRQKIRDNIIEMAKRDVAELERRMENYEIRSFSMYAQYFINREKRTVVALIRQSTNFPPLKDRPVSRGIAKCHPDDCFNAAIGRAIALRRALGLEVPDEYLNTPQPTEVRVGDVVAHDYFGKGVVTETNLPQSDWIERIVFHDGKRKWLAHKSDVKIVDDTRDEV